MKTATLHEAIDPVQVPFVPADNHLRVLPNLFDAVLLGNLTNDSSHPSVDNHLERPVSQSSCTSLAVLTHSEIEGP
jgi:hypothetical protein